MKRLILLLLLLSHPLLAQDYTFLGDYKSHEQKDSTLVVHTSNRDLTLNVHEGGVVKVLVGDEKGSTPLEMASLKAQPYSLEESPESLRLNFPEGRIDLQKVPLRMTITRNDGSAVLADDPSFGHGWHGNEVRTWKVLDDSTRFYGLGEKSGDVDKRGRFFTNWNSDIPAYRNDTDPLYCNIPFFSGVKDGKAFGIFFPNSYRSTYNLGAGNKRLYSFGADDGNLSYYVFMGPSMKGVLAEYTRLTGRPMLPPKWALGYQQCRWSYYPEYEIRDVAKEFRQREIPFDVLYFDIHFMDAYKVFTWHPERFPNPKQLLSDLQAQGIKTVTIIDP